MTVTYSKIAPVLLSLLLTGTEWGLPTRRGGVDAWTVRPSLAVRSASPLQRREGIFGTRPLSASTTTESPAASGTSSDDSTTATAPTSPAFPTLGDDGVYHVKNKEQLQALLTSASNQIVVLKVFAPWCRACKGLEPKFLQVAHDPKYASLPIVWAALSIQHNKQFVKSIGVLALPTIQFYVAGLVTDTFPCGPSKVPILKRKLAQLVNEYVDPQNISQLKPAVVQNAEETKRAMAATETAPANNTESVADTPVVTTDAAAGTANPVSTTTTTSVASDVAPDAPLATSWPVAPPATSIMTAAEREDLRTRIPFLALLSHAEFQQALERIQLRTFDAGAIIMREGEPGQTFYVIREGEVEICQRSLAEDPLQQGSTYLGTVINRLEKGDFFGERALITGEPRAASIRAAEVTSCWTLDQEDFPESSPLSLKVYEFDNTDDSAEGGMARLDEKYGVELTSAYSQVNKYQFLDTVEANQIRGSVNSPKPIKGVDTDEDVLFSEEDEDEASVALTQSSQDEGAIFALLQRFQMIRHVTRCFDYIQQTGAKWGKAGIRNRRAMLVKRLSPAQLEEFAATFDLIDISHDGQISVRELKRCMETIGESKSDQEIIDVFSTTPTNNNLVMQRQRNSNSTTMDGTVDRNLFLTKEDFMGLMAEAEFYYLFRDIFSSLDVDQTGFVKARELDRVLCGVRDLISDDRKSLIDVDDMDMLVDYDQFSLMLLGSTSI